MPAHHSYHLERHSKWSIKCFQKDAARNRAAAVSNCKHYTTPRLRNPRAKVVVKPKTATAGVVRFRSNRNLRGSGGESNQFMGMTVLWVF
ncbi:hypothetical protein L596_022348 [Steinernema carpocapsae]|uniref:Uncharacterized protein n=1 Tax=Steinernema carpocapsae TaxID=34508 RepID=A0A4U5MLH8_STECR|nr:hypothetical protein L596_022348 [Steinernema carpocapsae]